VLAPGGGVVAGEFVRALVAFGETFRNEVVHEGSAVLVADRPRVRVVLAGGADALARSSGEVTGPSQHLRTSGRSRGRR
jgi:hypothetical protein